MTVSLVVDLQASLSEDTSGDVRMHLEAKTLASIDSMGWPSRAHLGAATPIFLVVLLPKWRANSRKTYAPVDQPGQVHQVFRLSHEPLPQPSRC